ncbi:glycosyltransferase [Haploplasma axanthum]|nr:glycosyltransferase [Haploplasma axanthum]
MIILFVIDNYESQSNGATITTRRFREALMKRGHEVRVLTISSKKENGIYALKERELPLVTGIVHKQDTMFAKADKEIIKNALTGVDICHLMYPFKLSRVTNEIAKEMGIPVITSYHIMPENIVYGAGVRKYSFLFNWLVNSYFKSFYKKTPIIHAPSKMSELSLKKYYPKSKIYTISNGVTDEFFTVKNNPSIDKIRIVSIGRYSKEKGQDVTIKAIGNSIYRDKIELILPGKGKQEKRLRKLAKKYNIDVKFGFMSKLELMETLSSAYLFIHSAEIEIEGMSCLEAIAAGVVPIISDSKKSASNQFSLTANNLFKNRNSKDLTEKIEFWISNPINRNQNALDYRSFIENYRICNSVDKFETMFQENIKK